MMRSQRPLLNVNISENLKSRPLHRDKEEARNIDKVRRWLNSKFCSRSCPFEDSLTWTKFIKNNKPRGQYKLIICTVYSCWILRMWTKIGQFKFLKKIRNFTKHPLIISDNMYISQNAGPGTCLILLQRVRQIVHNLYRDIPASVLFEQAIFISTQTY